MDANLKTLIEAGTAVIADVFDDTEHLPPVLDNALFSLNRTGINFIGPAYTITGESHKWSGGGDRDKLKAIDDMEPGVVALWAGKDILGVCCFGDLLAEAMKSRGIAGVVVDGGIRDVAYLRTMGLPMLTRYVTPAQAIGRWKVTAVQEPVQVRGALEDAVTVNPGDIIAVDDDGAIVIPAGMIEEVTLKVAEWAESESGARD
ncbi:MAG: RraA family protein, partial [Thermaerobacterales bacterium]